MGRMAKVVVCGMKGVGKTAILEQVIYGNINADTRLHSTIEDIYVSNIESNRGVREKLRFYDTAGIDNSLHTNSFGSLNQQLPRHYFSLADGYILVYDTGRNDSLDVLYALKRDIDKNKDKKEIALIVIGNQLTPGGGDTTLKRAIDWCKQEKLQHFLVKALERNTLYDPFIQIANKLSPPANKSTLAPFYPRKTTANNV